MATGRRMGGLGIVAALLLGPGLLALQRPRQPQGPPPREWHVVGGQPGNARYSTLDQINSTNVTKLGGAWMTRLSGTLRQATPVVKNGVMYLSSSDRSVYALNAKTGAILWEQRLQQVPGPRGVAVADDVGMVFVPQTNVRLNGSVTALSAENGSVLWSHTLAADPVTGRRSGVSAAPTYVNGLLIVAGTGGDDGQRCPVVALDVKTGKEVWRVYTVAGPGERGHDTWPQDNDAWKFGGGAVWTTPAVDPELGLVYIGTGNASGDAFGVGPLNAHPLLSAQPQPALAGEKRKGDNLFTASVLAVDLKTGAYRWHYQLTRHDIWEMDVSTPLVLFDTVGGGPPRKGIAAMRTDGYLFLLDRSTGTPLLPVEERAVPQDRRLNTTPTQPFPVGDQVVPNCVEPSVLPPGFVGDCFFSPAPMYRPNVMEPFAGVRQSPMSYNPGTGYFYVAASVAPWWMTRYGWTRAVPGTKQYGILAAIDSRTNRIAWQRRMPHQLGFGGGSMTTAGNLVFHGEPDGNIQAYDAKTGDLIWQFQTGFGADSPVMTYEIDGEQHVAIAPRDGDAVWAFKLGGRIRPLNPPPAPPTEVPFAGPIDRASTVTIGVDVRERDMDRLDGVSIDDYATFQPLRVRVGAGAAVTWKNAGRMPHTATVRGENGNTGTIQPGSSASITFEKPGSYTYACLFHPWLSGQVIVDPPGSTAR
jgi:quinohemoprotein ethanol dehydrogenase